MLYPSESEAIVAFTRLAEAEGVSFSGSDSCDEEDCQWWGDHRCACGNRRVWVVVDQLTDGQFFPYAEAY